MENISLPLVSIGLPMHWISKERRIIATDNGSTGIRPDILAYLRRFKEKISEGRELLAKF